MRYQRLSVLLAAASLGAVLSGCVVAPLGPRYAGGYGGGPAVYVEPAPVVVAPGYYRGYRYWR